MRRKKDKYLGGLGDFGVQFVVWFFVSRSILIEQIWNFFSTVEMLFRNLWFNKKYFGRLQSLKFLSECAEVTFPKVQCEMSSI